MAALNIVSEFPTEELGYVSKVSWGFEHFHFPFQHIEEQAAELLHILLHFGVLLRPPERFYQIFGRHRFLILHHFVEQHLQGGWKAVGLSDLSRKDQFPTLKSRYLKAGR